jgi:hypothetical protein
VKKHHGDEAWLAALHGNSCRGKVRHPSKRHAKAAGRATPSRYYGFVLNAYHCKVCGGWHLGNSLRHLITDPSAVALPEAASPLERALADALRPYLTPSPRSAASC